MTELEMTWREKWQGRTCPLPGGGKATLSVLPDGRVTARAEWPGGRSGLHGDCGKPGRVAETHWKDFVRFAASHGKAKPQSLGKGASSPAPRGGLRYRQQAL